MITRKRNSSLLQSKAAYGFLGGLFVLYLLAFVAIAAFSQSAPGASTQAPTPPPASAEFASLSGHIFRTDTGKPLARAIVTLARSSVFPDDSQVRRTGPDGSYSFDMLDAGPYEVTATAVGFAPAAYAQGKTAPYMLPNQESVHLSVAESVFNIDVSLTPCTVAKCAANPPDMSIHPILKKGWVISGTLVDSNGEPLDGEVEAVGERPIFGPISERAVTDAQGRFQIVGTETEDVRVAMTAIGLQGAGYVTVYYPDSLSPDDAQVFKVAPGTAFRNLKMVFKAVPVYTVSGRVEVVNASAAAQRYVVTLSGGPQAGRTFRSQRIFVVRTDKTFQITGVQPGHYTVNVSAANRELLDGTAYYNEDFRRRGLGSMEVDVANSNLNVNIPIGGAAKN